MFRILILLIIVAAAVGYFTKPSEQTLAAAAQHQIENARDAAVQNMDLGGMISAGAAGVFGQGRYEDWYVASHYAQTLNDDPYVDCYGAFTQVHCVMAPHGGEAQTVQ